MDVQIDCSNVEIESTGIPKIPLRVSLSDIDESDLRGAITDLDIADVIEALGGDETVLEHIGRDKAKDYFDFEEEE